MNINKITIVPATTYSPSSESSDTRFAIAFENTDTSENSEPRNETNYKMIDSKRFGSENSAAMYTVAGRQVMSQIFSIKNRVAKFGLETHIVCLS